MGISQRQLTTGRKHTDVEQQRKNMTSQYKQIEKARREELNKSYPNNTEKND